MLCLALLGLVLARRTSEVPLAQRPAQWGEAAGLSHFSQLHVEAPARAPPDTDVPVRWVVETSGVAAGEPFLLRTARRLADGSVLEQVAELEHEPGDVLLAFESLVPGAAAGTFSIEGTIETKRPETRAVVQATITVDPEVGDVAPAAPTRPTGLYVQVTGPLRVHRDAPIEVAVFVEATGEALDGVVLEAPDSQGLLRIDRVAEGLQLGRLEPGRPVGRRIAYEIEAVGRREIQVRARAVTAAGERIVAGASLVFQVDELD